MRTIDADAALKALRKCQTYLYDARDPELKIELSSAEAAINNLPTIQPVATETNVGDTISRQAVINVLHTRFRDGFDGDKWWNSTHVLAAIEGLPSAQPEPSIPLSWVEKHIEWLKGLDNEFANLAAAHISVMVKKWRGEQHETD